MNTTRSWLRPTAAAIVTMIVTMTVTIGTAAAENATKWDGDDRAAARLIAGDPAATGGAKDGVVLRAGLELRLKPGWKTYWRYPGDSGMPPQFKFDGSENVKSVDVLWPAPKRFAEAGGNAIGYSGHVILPLHSRRKTPCSRCG